MPTTPIENRVAHINTTIAFDKKDGLSPIEHLRQAHNLFNPYLSGFRYDPDDRLIHLTCYMDRTNRILELVLDNLMGQLPFDIVDCIHGLFHDAQVERVEVAVCVNMIPHLNVTIGIDHLESWGPEEPDLTAYGISDVTTVRKISDLADAGRRTEPLASYDVRVQNVSMIMEWGEETIDLGRQTSSLNMSIGQDGTVSVKQIIMFDEYLGEDTDPSDPAIIENIRGRIRFAPPTAGANFYRTGVNRPPPEAHPVIVSFGRDMELWIKDVKLTDLTYVDEMMTFPDKDAKEPDSMPPDGEGVSRYRLYYSGKIQLGKKG